jgi:hypothetical protein
MRDIHDLFEYLTVFVNRCRDASVWGGRTCCVLAICCFSVTQEVSLRMVAVRVHLDEICLQSRPSFQGFKVEEATTRSVPRQCRPRATSCKQLNQQGEVVFDFDCVETHYCRVVAGAMTVSSSWRSLDSAGSITVNCASLHARASASRVRRVGLLCVDREADSDIENGFADRVCVLWPQH